MFLYNEESLFKTTYLNIMSLIVEATPKEDVNPEAIYANNEMSLADIEVYGFDYDYTLATYTPALHKLIFDLGKQALVSKLKVLTRIWLGRMLNKLTISFFSMYKPVPGHIDESKYTAIIPYNSSNN